jgi:signal transduction histidine kinase/CheY-like chemotaxis protein
VLGLEVVAFTVSTLPGVRAQPGFDGLLDGWLQGATYLTAALLCTLRPVLVEEDRRIWSWIAAGVTARALGFVAFLAVIRELDPIPYPSVDDAFWLAMYGCFFVALVSLARSRFVRVSASLLLDGIVAALATTALALALLEGTLRDLTAPGTPAGALATNLAFPIGDVMLLIVILGVLVAFAWRPPVWVWALGATIAGFAVIDAVFVYQVTAGTFTPGTLLQSLAMLLTVLIAFVAWVRPGPVPERRSDALPGLVAPALATFLCLGLLVYGSLERLPADAVLLAAGGLVVATVRAALTFRDLQRLSAELRAARAEAERASGAKTEFLSGMSHELRTPLNSILGFAQLIEADATDEQERDYARRIIAGGRHLVALIDDLLDVARLERGRLGASLASVPAAAAVREALELTAPSMAGRGIELEERIDSDRYVQADFRRLRQVLLNLLSNAVKYNRERGRVTVAISEPAPATVRIAVADTGPGIAQERIERLFRPFERLDAEGTGKPGTGLGLALSKGLVEQMGGSIGVSSEPGVGTTFYVDLQAAEPAAPAGTQGASRQRGPMAGTLLYVEDDAANIRLVADVFAAESGVNVLATTRGASAVDLVERHHVDAVLLDVNLPDMDGESVLTGLRRRPATASTPVIVVSADATEATRQRLLAAGAVAYVTKPIEVAQLVDAVRAALGQATGSSRSAGSSVRNPSTTSGSNWPPR